MPNLLRIIQQRHSERGPFDPDEPISGQQLGLILEAARWAPTPHNMQNFEILVVDDKEKLNTIQKFQSDASETFLRESYAQLSFSEEELIATKNRSVSQHVSSVLDRSASLAARLRLPISACPA
jgi:nitroreductase